MSSKITYIKNRLKTSAVGTFLRRYKWNREILSKDTAVKAVNKYMPEAAAEEKQKIVQDILNMARKYRFSAEEYFYYHFIDRTEAERSLFCSDLNRVDICESLNDPRNLPIFNNKIKTYDLFGRFYGRDVCGVIKGDEAEFHRLVEFVNQHERFIVKPVDSSCGKGIQIVDLSDCRDKEKRIRELMAQYCTNAQGGLIAEELIVQHPEMAQFHPSSVNTVRVATIRYDEGAEAIGSFFRIGRGSSIVDNAGAGGVFGTVDVATGEILAIADEFGNSYTNHPDTNIPLVGFVIPQWEKALELAKELAMVIEGNRYAGWDLALTEKGWVMVEGNARGQFLWQIPVRKGFMPEINRILRKLGRAELTKTGV